METQDVKCKDCSNNLPLSNKPNLSGRCLPCRKIAQKSSNNPTVKAYQAAYRAKHREKRNAEKRQWYQDNKAHKLEKDRVNRKANPEKYRAMQNKYWTNRYHTDIQYKLRKILRSSLKRSVFTGSKSILEYLDCSLEEVKLHIESQFTDKMNWDNHGSVWHIDHIKPLCSFDLTKEEEIRLATCKNNLQPLLVEDNLAKSAEDKQYARY